MHVSLQPNNMQVHAQVKTLVWQWRKPIPSHHLFMVEVQWCLWNMAYNVLAYTCTYRYIPNSYIRSLFPSMTNLLMDKKSYLWFGHAIIIIWRFHKVLVREQVMETLLTYILTKNLLLFFLFFFQPILKMQSLIASACILITVNAVACKQVLMFRSEMRAVKPQDRHKCS